MSIFASIIGTPVRFSIGGIPYAGKVLGESKDGKYLMVEVTQGNDTKSFTMQVSRKTALETVATRQGPGYAGG